MVIYLKKEEKEKLIKAWNMISKRYEIFNFKPTEATEEQIEYISGLVKLLDRRDASTLITLLQIIHKNR